MHYRRRAFEIRLRSGPSFREKLDQLVSDAKTKRAQILAPFLISVDAAFAANFN